jgi:hypothetical protein
MWLLAKEIFKNTYTHASMMTVFFENCLGSEELQIFYPNPLRKAMES